MNSYSNKNRTINWLGNKLYHRESGIFINDAARDRFDKIQHFLGLYEYPFHTPVIYYEAFTGEGSKDFLDTLTQELAGKIRPCDANPADALKEITQKVNLKMVIIDKCHLQSLEALDQIMKKLYDLNISMILAGSYHEMNEAEILKHPSFTHWDRVYLHQEDGKPPLRIINSSQQAV